jgi:hypothetical protein
LSVVVTTVPGAAHGINDVGDIVGRCWDASGKELGWLLRHDGSFAPGSKVSACRPGTVHP